MTARTDFGSILPPGMSQDVLSRGTETGVEYSVVIQQWFSLC